MDKQLIDALWLVFCAGQVFLMQAGFVCLESGLTRSKNNINVAVKNLTDLCIAIILFWCIGFGLMFGSTFHGGVGTSAFLPDMSRLGAWPAAFLLFQIMFCGTAVTIISGATAERMRYRSYIIITIMVAGLIYPVFGHWAWNGMDVSARSGWLANIGFVDFAGSTVVHSVGGWVALAAVMVLGPRIGRFPDDGPPQEIPGTNLPISVLGVVLLWYGWFGFNGGSTLGLTDRVPLVLLNTALAGGAGLMAVLILRSFRQEKVRVVPLINGVLAGLVAITANSNAVAPISAIVIGLIGGVVMLFVEDLLIHYRIDDAIGAIPVHVGAGVWGSLAVALFGQPEQLATGLGFWSQLMAQCVGVFICFFWAFGVSYLILIQINRVFPLRVPVESEHIGLNVSEHGATNELLDLFTVMDRQSQTEDLSLRAPVEPFTEVGQIADRYNQVITALEQANLAKGRFLGNISHKIRTPLNSILGYCKVMRENNGLTDQQQKHLEAINQSGEHLHTLFDDILNRTKIEAGHISYGDNLSEVETSSNPGSEVARSLNQDDLKNLPAELVTQMREAAANGYLKQLDELINVVEEKDTQIAKVLRELASNYEYDTLAELFKLDEKSL